MFPVMKCKSLLVFLSGYPFSPTEFVPGDCLPVWAGHLQWPESSTERDDRGEPRHNRHRRGVQGAPGAAAPGGQAGAGELRCRCRWSPDVGTLALCDTPLSDSLNS